MKGGETRVLLKHCVFIDENEVVFFFSELAVLNVIYTYYDKICSYVFSLVFTFLKMIKFQFY